MSRPVPDSRSRQDADPRSRLMTLLVLAGIALAAGITFWLWQPAPPKKVVMSTGAPDGAYQLYASRYRDALARQGVTLELRPSSGAVENLQRLRDPNSDVQLAIVQSGLTPHADGTDGLVSLGHLFYEPLWLFSRGAKPVSSVSDLTGKRIAIGAAGSGTQVVANAALHIFGLDQSPTESFEIGGSAAAQALLDGAVDAAFFVGAPESPTIDRLLRDPSVSITSFHRAAAFARRAPFLSKVDLPAGVIDPPTDLPNRDIVLVAPTAILLARDDLHPVIVDLMIEAAREVHGQGTLLNGPGVFPNTLPGEYETSEDAERYYRNGPGFLRRYLPLWTAVWVQRLLVIGLPLLAILGPLLRFAPGIWMWRIRRRLYRWNNELQFVELDMLKGRGNPAEHLQLLKDIDLNLLNQRVPDSVNPELYVLRQHLRAVLAQLEKQIETDDRNPAV
jgi:TRAP transporter TAXI family solute receptor